MTNPDKIRILIVEDLPSDAELVMRETLKELPNAEFRHIETEPEFLHELEDFRPDLILTDYSMPRFNGLRALKLSLEYDSTIPVIIVTGSINEDTAVDCMKAGAANYVIKDQMKRLGPAIRHALEEKENLLAKKKAQHELEEERARFNALAENSFDIMTILSADGIIRYESDATEHVLGYKAGKRVGQNVFDSVHPDDASLVMESFSKLAKGEIKRASVEFRFRHENNKWIWLEANGQNLLQNPFLKGILVNSRDITSRKKAEEELKAKQDFLTGIIENSDNLIFVKDAIGRYELVNRKWEETTGLKRKDVIGRLDTELFPGEVGEKFKNNDQKVFKTRKVVDVEEVLGEGNSISYFNSIKFPLFDKDGNVSLMCGMSRDVTERHKMEMELKKSEEKFRDLFAHSPAGLYRTTVDGIIIDANPALIKMLLYQSLEDLKKRSVSEGYVDLSEKARFDKLMHENGRFSGISKWYRSDGSIIWLEEQAVAIKDEKGNILFFDGSVIDVTEKKKAQDKLVESELKYRTLYEGAGDAILILREDHFIDCNAAAEKMFGRSKEEILFQHPAQLSPKIQKNGEASDVLASKNIQLAKEQKQYFFEWQHSRSDGSIFEAEVSLQAVEIHGELLLQSIVRDVTERKLLMQNITNSEEKYRLLFENITQGFANHEIVFDENEKPVDYRFLSVNPAFEKLTGLHAADIVGKTFSEVLPDGEVEWLQRYSEVAITGKSVQFESFSKPLEKYYEVFAFSPRKNEFAVVFHETTERVLAAKQLKESEEKYRLVADNSADVIFIIDNQFRYSFISPSIEKLRGFKPEDILKMSIDQSMTKESFLVVKKAIAAQRKLEDEGLLDRNSSQILELEMLHKNGHTIWTEVKASFLRNSENEIIGILGITRDISERKAAEQKIKEKNRILLTINQYAQEISQKPFSELFSFIVDNLKFISGSSVALINIYDEDRKELVCQKTTLTNEESGTVEKLLGGRIEGFRTPVTPEMLARIKQEVIGKAEDLSTLTFGKIPKALGNVIMAATRYKWFLGISLTKDEKLIGTILLGGKKGDEPINKEEFLAFAGITANAIARAQAEEKLKSSEEKYRIIAENTADTITILDFEFKYLFSSPSIQRMLGYSVDEILKLETAQIMHPDSIDIIRQLMREEMKLELSGKADPNRSRTVVLKEFHKDGSIRWIESTASFIRDENGTPLNILAVSRDVTERKKEAELLAKSQEEFKAIFENNASAIAILNMDTTVAMVNEAFGEISGYSIEETVGRSWTSMIATDDLEKMKEYNRIRLENPAAVPDKYEFSFLRKDGQIRYALMSVALIPSSKKIVASFSDITERRNAEKALIESEIRYRTIFNNSVEGIYQTTPDGRYRTINPSFAHMYGYESPDEMIAEVKDIKSELYANPEDRDVFVEMLLQPSGVVRNFETQMKRKDGSLFWVSINGKMMYNDNGDEAYIEGTCFDITERKIAVQALFESEARFKALHNASFGGIAIHDVGLILECNQGLSEITGFSYEELVGMDGFLLIAENDRDTVMHNIVSDYFEPYEVVGLRKNGEEYALRLEARAIPYKGKVVRSVEFRDITDQKIAEDKLRQSNAFLDSVIENIPNMLFVKDADTLKFVRINNAGERLMGFSAEQMIGKSDFDFFPQKEAEFFTQKDRDVLLSKEPLDIQEEIISSNQLGNRILHTRKVPILDVDGNPLYLLGISEDITEQKEAAAKIKESEEKFRNMFENSPVGKSMTGIDGSMVVNKSFCNIVGYSETELKGGKWMEITHPDDIELSNSIVNQLLNGEKTIDRFEKRYIHKNGNVIWADVSVYLQKDNLDNPLFFITTIFDITERKSLLEALKAGEAKYRSYVESAPYGVFVTDEKGNYLEVNPAASRITGYNYAELKQMNLRDFMPEEYVEAGAIHFQSLELDVVKTAEIPFIHKSGQIRWWTVSAVKLNENKFLGFTEDVTEKKNADLLLHESEEKFKNLAESSPFAIMIYQNAKWVYSNPAGERISGFALDELVKMNFWEFVHPDDVEMVKNKGMLRQAGEATDASYEFRIISKSGELKWVFLTGTSILYQEKSAGLVSIADISERKKAEDALNESRQLFESLANMAPVGIFRTDAEGTTTYVNPKWCELSGLKFEEALGDGWLNSLVPEDVESIKEGWQQTIRKRTTSIAEYRFRHTNGEIVWVYGKAIPEVVNGILQGYIGTITDFTERKKAEIALNESRQLFESLANMSPVGIFRTDDKGNTTYVNPKWSEITGLTFEEAKGKQWHKAIHPNDLKQSIVAWDNAVLKEGESVAEFRFNHVNGEVRWVFGKAVPERKDGQLVGYIGTITDITERKLFENAILENQKNLKRAEQVAGFGNWAINMNDLSVRVSEGAALIYGLEFKQFTLEEIQVVPLPEYRQALNKELELLVKDKKKYNIEFEIIRPTDGEKRLIHSIAEYDSQSNMVFGVIRDITEYKKLQQQLIDQQIQQREIVEAELAKTKDALVRSTRLAAVGQISATIAHDLRNPLGAVRNAAYYLKRKLTDGDPKVLNYFNIIDSEVETADKIISNLLQMAKVKEPEKARNDFREVIDLAMGEQYAKLNIEIQIELDKEPFILLADKVQIVQVVRNLLENSSHTDTDKVLVDVKGRHIDDGVELIFCDNGPGISKEVRDSLFEPLITTKAKGTGLGLTICKQIIEKHGGSIVLVDKPNMGACFKIVLPLK